MATPLHNQTDSQGRKQGYWEETDEYGFIRKGHYVDDLRQGLWKVYYDDIHQAEEHYLNGKRHGLWKRYHHDGVTLWIKGHYLDDKRQGLWKRYRPDGTFESCTLYNMDKELFSSPLLILPSWLNLL